MKEKLQKWIHKEYTLVVVVFALLVLFKLCVILPVSSGPISFGDEALYKKFSLQWFTLGRQTETQYPPVYPLLLSVSFFFRDSWYTAMLVLNMLYSSFVPVFFYLIARLYLDRKKSIGCLIIGSVIPFHFILPTMILSENVFFPLLFLEIWLVLREYKKHPLAGDFLIGFFLAVLCLSRYISIVTIPVFALVWLMKESELGKKFGVLILRGFFIVGVMALTYLPWILMHYKNMPFKQMIGFGVASDPAPEQLTPERLLLTAVLYLCYYVLLALPVLPTLLKSFALLDLRKPACRYNQLWVMVAGLAGAFFVAVTRHSWRVSYNWPVFSRIMGRYLICFPLLFVLLALATWVRGQERTDRREEADKTGTVESERKEQLRVGVLVVVSTVLAVFSYVADIGQIGDLIGGVLYQGSAEQFLNFKGSMEGYKYVMIGVPFLILGIGIMTGIHFAGVSRWKKYRFLIFCVCVAFFEIHGMGQYVERMNAFREEKGSAAIQEMNRLLASEFPPIAETPEPQEELVRFWLDLPEGTSGVNWEKWCQKFYGNHYFVKFTTKFEKIQEGEAYYVVTEHPEDYAPEKVVKVVGTFRRKGVTDTLMLVTK